jgi:hypothetical protein
MEKQNALDWWGLLWFDDDPKRTLKQKIEMAATRHHEKEGKWPNLCYVHPTMLQAACAIIGDVNVVANDTVLKHHFWIGVAKERE